MVTQPLTVKLLTLFLAVALLSGRPSTCSHIREKTLTPDGGGGGVGSESHRDELEDYLTPEGAGSSSREVLDSSREIQNEQGIPGRRLVPTGRQGSSYQVPGHQIPALKVPLASGGRHHVTSRQVTDHQVPGRQVMGHQVQGRQGTTGYQITSGQGTGHQISSHQVPGYEGPGRHQVYPAATPSNPHRRTRRGNHLQFYGLEVPVYKFRGENARLKCNFDRRSDPLYSVKWYKDDHEFFSFMSKRNPPKKTFPRAGVDVDIHRSNSHLVLLKNLTFESSGIYKCEVSADSPLFHTYYNESLMVVVELPEDGPKISGGQTHYAQGETARFNCTSSRSKPAAELTWYINDEPAQLSSLVPYYPYEHGDGLISRRLGLTFTVEKGHFNQGAMNLKCEAVVAAVYDPVGLDETKVMERDPDVLNRGHAAIVVLSGASAVLPSYATMLMLVVLTGEQAVT
ncbi:uncharacterized protein LOC122253809 [Penaeus japonicus]|uniref:uncharacterized protein LOC122253809 n=1 Tax=Penaeus japonicus TaxID=27405 RepID=UPI001C717694|nr:uncharacterized protein LOC122253809 [Penaeus japonicus]XP_042873067.1 uncharacterized protein LOC122253809 [Penaeus japonicus]